MTIINKNGLVNSPHVRPNDQVLIRDGDKVRLFEVVPAFPFLDLDSKLGRIIESYLYDKNGQLTDFGREQAKNYNFPPTITDFNDSFLTLQEVKHSGVTLTHPTGRGFTILPTQVNRNEELLRKGLSGNSITLDQKTGTLVQLINGQASGSGINRTDSPSTIIIDINNISENNRTSFINALNTATSSVSDYGNYSVVRYEDTQGGQTVQGFRNEFLENAYNTIKANYKSGAFTTEYQKQTYGGMSLTELIAERDKLFEKLNPNVSTGARISEDTNIDVQDLAYLDAQIEGRSSEGLGEGYEVRIPYETQSIGTDLKKYTYYNNSKFTLADMDKIPTPWNVPSKYDFNLSNEFLDGSSSVVYPYSKRDVTDIAAELKVMVDSFNNSGESVFQLDYNAINSEDLSEVIIFNRFNVGAIEQNLADREVQTDESSQVEGVDNNLGSGSDGSSTEEVDQVIETVAFDGKTNETENTETARTDEQNWEHELSINKDNRTKEVERVYGVMDAATKLKIRESPLTALEVEEGF